MKEVKKFDICLMNPPYNIGKRFFSKILDVSNIIITIQPTNWLMTEKQNKQIISKKEIKTYVKKTNILPIILITLGVVLIIFAIYKSFNKLSN